MECRAGPPHLRDLPGGQGCSWRAAAERIYKLRSGLPGYEMVVPHRDFEEDLPRTCLPKGQNGAPDQHQTPKLVGMVGATAICIMFCTTERRTGRHTTPEHHTWKAIQLHAAGGGAAASHAPPKDAVAGNTSEEITFKPIVAQKLVRRGSRWMPKGSVRTPQACTANAAAQLSAGHETRIRPPMRRGSPPRAAGCQSAACRLPGRHRRCWPAASPAAVRRQRRPRCARPRGRRQLGRRHYHCAGAPAGSTPAGGNKAALVGIQTSTTAPCVKAHAAQQAAMRQLL